MYQVNFEDLKLVSIIIYVPNSIGWSIWSKFNDSNSEYKSEYTLVSYFQ